MTGRGSGPLAAAIGVLWVGLAGIPAALRAQEAAPPDSSLHRFLGTMADSTDRYFGLIAAPLDTAGLDSALTVGLERPWQPRRSRTRFWPKLVFDYNRVDGALWGGSMAFSNRSGGWQVGGDIGYTTGSDTWLGGGFVSWGFRRRESSWRLRVQGGRRTQPMDRDDYERRMATVRAVVLGTDARNYLRRDGVAVGLTGDGRDWHLGFGYRNRLESPLVVTTDWNLFNNNLENPNNLAAASGRAHELTFEIETRAPGLPIRTQLASAFSDRWMGSDFDYRRVRVVAGADLSVGRHLSLVPQVAYGRLGGDPQPQVSFYLGGTGTLRSLPGDTLGGTGIALARLEIIGADDLLALAHIPHPAMFPIQGAVFLTTGAVWGDDPFGGPGSRDEPWPERNAWLSEAGWSLLYRPGIPDGDAYLRLNYARGLGADDRRGRWTISYSRALDLLRPF